MLNYLIVLYTQLYNFDASQYEKEIWGKNVKYN